MSAPYHTVLNFILIQLHLSGLLDFKLNLLSLHIVDHKYQWQYQLFQLIIIVFNYDNLYEMRNYRSTDIMLLNLEDNTLSLSIPFKFVREFLILRSFYILNQY